MLRRLLAVAVALTLAAPAFAAAKRPRTLIERARDFTQMSIKSLVREFEKVNDAMHGHMVDVRDGTANAMTDIQAEGRKGMESVRTSVSIWSRRAFAGTHRTMDDLTQNVFPHGGRAEEVAPTITAREITSPILDPVFLRRHDIVLAWRTSMGGRPARRSLIADDRVLFEDTSGELYSFDPRNGVAQWVYPLPRPSQFDYREDEDHVFVVASDTLYELDRRVGLPRRRIPLPFPASSRPSFGTDLFVMASWDRRVYCMDREKRVKLWVFIPVESVTSAAGLAPDLVFVAETDGKLSAYSPVQRRAMWQYKADDSIRVDLVVDDTHIIFPAEDLFVHCLNRFGGFRSWKFPVRGFVRQPVWVTDERCYFAAEGDAFYAVDAFKGSLIWRVPGGGWPVAIGSQNVYIQGADDEVWAIDLKTGEKVWTVSAKPFTYIARNSDNDHIYLGSKRGDIYALYLRGDHLEKKEPVLPPKPPEDVEKAPDVEKPAEPERPAVPEVESKPDEPVEPRVPAEPGFDVAPEKPKPKPKTEEDW